MEQQQQQQQQQQPNDKIVSSESKYNPRKPKWWNKLGNNGRGATKAQKRCMRKILDGDIENNNGDEATTDNGANADNDNDNGGEGLKLKLRLPTVEYGSKLNWDDVFDTENDYDNGDNNNKDKDKDSTRDIWLEIGFGRGENVSSLLDLKLLNNKNNNNNNNNNNSKNNNFYLIGAEVSSIGIGCLCKQIDQRFNNNSNNNNDRIIDKNDVNDDNDNDKGYVLYHPELDPYHHHHNHHDGNKDDEGDDIDVDAASPYDNNNSESSDVDDDHSLQLLQNHFRIHTGDGYKLLFKIPTNTLANILITFPDPFEKINDTQYRLIQKQTLLECYRILRKSNSQSESYNGLLYLATDHDGYYDWCHQMIHEVNNCNDGNGNDNDDNDTVPQLPLFRLVEPCPNRKNWLPAVSRYEQKGWTEGRSTKLSCWQVVVQ
jgi:tRNA G46 methylase TrmB